MFETEMKNMRPAVYMSTNPGMAICKGKCSATGLEYTTAEFPIKAYRAWSNGALIQEALHMLSEHDREFMISGLSPDGWNQTFLSGMDD